MKKLFLLLAVVLFAGCGSLYSTMEPPKTGMLDPEYAYVLIAAPNDASTWGHTSKRYNQSHKSTEKFTAAHQERYKITYQLFKVLPGKFTVIDLPRNSISMPKAMKEHNETLKENSASVGYLTAEKGKITYVGIVRLYESSGKYYFKVDTDVDGARKFLKENYPGLFTEDNFMVNTARSGNIFW